LIVDELALPYVEFNAVSPAGIPTVTRLTEMLKEAAFAFLVLTAEDDRADGGKQARLNVVHEAGLFQGYLGFEKAIILLEEGCEEFSNIRGLGQIRFTPGSVRSAFEDIRSVLKREKIIQHNRS
jgi:predicted nucleotide-binding protein